LTPQQVDDLENNHINIIKDEIDKELQSKLGLSLTPLMKAKISRSAMIACWILMY
jgi:hypothetical protein